MSSLSPEINIAGHGFLVDLHADHIIASGPGAGSSPIPFVDMKGSFWRPQFLLDTHTLSRYTPPAGIQKLPGHILCVELSHKALLAPEGFCDLNGVARSVIPKDILALRQEQPLATVLEKIKLAGHEYFIDKIGLRFLDSLDLNNRLFFHWFKQNAEGGLSLLYNRDTRTIAARTPGENRKAWQSIDMPATTKVYPNLEAASQKTKLIESFLNKIAAASALQVVEAKKRPRKQTPKEINRKRGRTL